MAINYYRQQAETLIKPTYDRKRLDLLAQKDSINNNYNTQVDNQNTQNYNAINAFNQAQLSKGMIRSDYTDNKDSAYNFENNRVLAKINAARGQDLNGVDQQINLLPSEQESATLQQMMALQNAARARNGGSGGSGSYGSDYGNLSETARNRLQSVNDLYNSDKNSAYKIAYLKSALGQLSNSKDDRMVRDAINTAINNLYAIQGDAQAHSYNASDYVFNTGRTRRGGMLTPDSRTYGL